MDSGECGRHEAGQKLRQLTALAAAAGEAVELADYVAARSAARATIAAFLADEFHVHSNAWLRQFPEGLRCDGDGKRREECEDLVELLLSHRSNPAPQVAGLACWIAASCTGDDHLWQDMCLPSREHLTALMRDNFGPLFARNTGNMRWKRFFYKQLCERADVFLCKAPTCGECVDYQRCFVTDAPAGA